MKTKRTSAESSKLFKKSHPGIKTTPLGESIVRGFQEAIDHMRGEGKLLTRVIQVP